MNRKRNLDKLKSLLFALFGLFILYSCENENLAKDDNAKSEYFVSLDLAKTISKNIKFKSTLNNRLNSGKTIESVFPVIDEKNVIVYYIINFTQGGYIILSADKRSIPILAYSEDNNFPTNFEDYPSELVDWLEFAKNQIKQIRDENLEQPEEFVNMWKEYDNLILNNSTNTTSTNNNNQTTSTSSSCSPSFQQFGPLLQTTWSQTSGYNNLMPTASQIGCSSIASGNNRAFAGCVPIAIAQVMKYHNYPSSFNWSAMPNNYGTSTTSNLVFDIHTKIINAPNSIFNPNPLSYSCDGTGVSSSYDVGNLFRNKYKYSTAQYNSVFQMPHSLRMQLEIMQNRPVILDGGRKSGWWIFAVRKNGHMWVCDGFTKEVICVTLNFPRITIPFTINRFHMNWGWGGYLNGYYTYGNFNPGSNDFNYQVGLLYNIKP